MRKLLLNKVFRLSLLCFTLIGLLACSNSSNKENSIETGSYFSMKMNGELWIADYASNTYSKDEDNKFIIHINATKFLEDKVTKRDGISISLVLDPSLLAKPNGTYPIKSFQDGYVSINSAIAVGNFNLPNNPIIYSTYEVGDAVSTETNYVSIESFKEGEPSILGLNAYSKLTGSFAFDFYMLNENDELEKLEVTEGEFNLGKFDMFDL